MNKLTLKNKAILNNTIILSVMIVFFVADRYLKELARGSSVSYPLLGDWLKFSFVPNYFAAFSLPLAGLWFTIILFLAVLGLAGASYYYYFMQTRRDVGLALWLIFLGAASNLLDRLSGGYVVDYLDLKYFTVFNGADVMITVGTIYILWREWHRKEK
jgi:signal peptidase II